MSDDAPALPNRIEPSPYALALLPWEDDEAFRLLREEYFAVHPPGSPAERHILEQLVWCDWRRRRLVLGERALHMASLHQRSDNTDNDSLTQRANVMYGGRAEISSRDALHAAQKSDAPALEDAREWWESELEDDERYKADAESLLGFLLVRGLQKVRRIEADMELRPHIRLQAWGESLDPDRMDKLLQLDERLLRQYEKLLGMLGRLQKRPTAKAIPVTPC